MTLFASQNPPFGSSASLCTSVAQRGGWVEVLFIQDIDPVEFPEYSVLLSADTTTVSRSLGV